MPAPELSIIVPVYNEERTVAGVMKRLTEALPDAQIIYVDDGSNDGSFALLSRHARAQDLVLSKQNGGKGSAIREGLKRVRGAYTIIQDADLEYDPKEIGALLRSARAHPGHVVFGSRFLKPNPNLYRCCLWGNKLLTAFTNLLFRGHLTDSYTCYKLFPTDILRVLPLSGSGFEIEAELCAETLKRGIPIIEVPISYRPRSIEAGKKIRLKDAWRGLLMMLKVRTGRRNTASPEHSIAGTQHRRNTASPEHSMVHRGNDITL